MGDMDDQLQKVAEQLFDQMDHDLTVRFPHRRADIAALLTVAGPKKNFGEKRTRGVKGFRGRPPINKGVLMGWILLLVKIATYNQFYVQIEQGKSPSSKLIPARRWSFNWIAKMGLAYSIAEGSNPIKYPLTSASTLKRHYTFSSSNTFDDWAAKDAFIAYKNLSRNLSVYLGRTPVDEAYRFMQVGDDPDQFLAHWDYMMSKCDAEDPEPWRRDFQVTEKDTESGPPMVLHFPPMRKSSWTALRTGLGIWGFIEMENHKKDPPSKDRIAAYQEFRRNNPVTDMRKLHSEEIENHGS